MMRMEAWADVASAEPSELYEGKTMQRAELESNDVLQRFDPNYRSSSLSSFKAPLDR
jgi:hypothetical protein